MFDVPPGRALSSPSAQPLRTDALRVYALRSYARAGERETAQPRPSAQRTSDPRQAAAPSGAPAPRKTAAPSETAPPSETAAGGQPRQIARALLGQFHWQAWQFTYLNLLWAHESGWNPQAVNPNSGAYGIPQAVPGSKMASAGPDWRSDARTQIIWGMRYIQARYGSPYRAWQHERGSGWY